MTEPQYQHERTEPRRVKKGILIGEEGPDCTGDSPASRLWLSVLERSSKESKAEGLRWGTLGQAMSILGLPGRIRMKVQGIRRQPHEVDLLVPVLSETVREMVVERLSEDPRNLVRIEEGGIPSNLVGLIRELGGRLVPTGADLSAELMRNRLVLNTGWSALRRQLLSCSSKTSNHCWWRSDFRWTIWRSCFVMHARCVFGVHLRRTEIPARPPRVPIQNETFGAVGVHHSLRRWAPFLRLLC